jgi:hypothetical protein
MFATVNYTAAGGANAVYSIPFASLAPEHISVKVTYADESTEELDYGTDYTVNSARTQVTVIPAVTAGATVKVYRDTPLQLSNFSADFQNGTVLKAGDLNLATTHLLYLDQEAKDREEETADFVDDKFLKESSPGGPWAARSRRISNVAAGVQSTDAVNKSQLDTLQNSIVPLGTLDALASQGVAVEGESQFVEIIHAQCGRYTIGGTNKMWAGATGASSVNPQSTVNLTADVDNDSTTTAKSTFKLPFMCLGASDITVQKYDLTHDPETHLGGLGAVLATPADYTVDATGGTITFTTPIAANPAGGTSGPWYGFEVTRTSAPAYLPGHPWYWYKASGVGSQTRTVYRTPTAGLGPISGFTGADWKNTPIYHGIDSGDPRLCDDGIFIPKGVLGDGAKLEVVIHGTMRNEATQLVRSGTGLTPTNAQYTQEARDVYFLLDFNSNVLGRPAVDSPGSGKHWEITYTMGAGAFPVLGSETWTNGVTGAGSGVTVDWTSGTRQACLNALPEQPFKLTYQIVTTHRPSEGPNTSAETDEAYCITATLEIPSLTGGAPEIKTWVNNLNIQNPQISAAVWKFYDSSEFDPVYPAVNGHQSYLGNTMLNFRAAIEPHSVWGDDGLARVDIHSIHAYLTRNRLS